MRKSPLRRHPRPAAETERIYGPPERRAWVQSLPCLACGRIPCENAHVPSKSGMGRKGDYTTIVPLCGWNGYGMPSDYCHGELHRIGVKAFEAKYGLDLMAAAADVEKQWLESGLARKVADSYPKAP